MAHSRYKMRRRHSRRVFKKTAKRVHRKNFMKPMRGGYRI
jgi:hypothetical protein